MEQTTTNIYSDSETAKLETEVRSLEEKNARLRDLLTKMGVSVIGIETGQTWIEENQKLETQ